jgi:hypothetical protein
LSPKASLDRSDPQSKRLLWWAELLVLKAMGSYTATMVILAR